MSDRGSAEAAAPSPPPLEWKFSQVFGERTVGEEVQEGTCFFQPFRIVDAVFFLLRVCSFLLTGVSRDLLYSHSFIWVNYLIISIIGRRLAMP